MTATTNRVGLCKQDYEGSKSTMCKGCGHDRISEAIVQVGYDMSLAPHRVVKMSGIGCSSKTPAYFIGSAFGLNSTHGRMPSFATGAHVGNRELTALGVSGDGDTASIGIGQFVHMVRRNPKLTYIVENNGVYGLTKGQFSATADTDSPSKRGKLPTDGPIDLCGLAIELGCGFVARSFSGDKKQLVPLLKAALSYNGLAFVDVISPCVTFNNHETSTKSYTLFKDRAVQFHDPTFVPECDPIDVDYDPGETRQVALHGGSCLRLKKLDRDYDPTDLAGARRVLGETRAVDTVLTGLIYVDTKRPALMETQKLTAEPLATLGEAELRPSKEQLGKINARFRV
ncbi:MAG: 2-oxoacid:ferredoxin oxidoreductase subunit beta [Planctomycetes bacterium]|nr:2-oxoacid:ferredoxin oxidoreductase subunit beta [Planctomycetota bacterium]